MQKAIRFGDGFLHVKSYDYSSTISFPLAEESYIACIILAVIMTVSICEGSFSPVRMQRTKESISAALRYLFYSIAGAMMGLLAVFFVYAFTGESSQFAFGGILDAAKVTGNERILLAAVMAGIVGFGAKAGMYPRQRTRSRLLLHPRFSRR